MSPRGERRAKAPKAASGAAAALIEVQKLEAALEQTANRRLPLGWNPGDPCHRNVQERVALESSFQSIGRGRGFKTRFPEGEADFLFQELVLVAT